MEHLCLDVSVYTRTVDRQNARIYRPKAMYFRILSTCDSIFARYFDVFLWIYYLSSPILNDIELKLKTKYTQVRNTTAKQTNKRTVSQIIHKTLRNYYLLTKGDLHVRMQEYDVPIVNELDIYEVNNRRFLLLIEMQCFNS